MESRGRTLLKAVLSVVIVAQLLCVVLAPNQNTYLRSRFAKEIDPYVNLLGLGATWSFFAPEPGPPPIYIDYELYDKNGGLLAKNSWPEKGQKFLFHDRALRRGAAAQFMLMHPEYASSMLIPYLCRTHPGTDSVRLWSVVYEVPKMKDVAEGKRRIGDNTDPDRKAITFDFCPGSK